MLSMLSGRSVLRGKPCAARSVKGPSTGLPRLPCRTPLGHHPRLHRHLSPLHPHPASTSSSTSTSVASPTASAPTAADPASPSSSSSPGPSSSPSPASQPASETFSWTAAWYPVAPTAYLDPTRPHPFTLLGRDLVLWRDGGGVWRAFEDACPHRLAPLSEGRVESDGSLLCAYHAWRFDGSGRCTALPQAESREAESRACSNPRSCARVYPTCEAQGLLWVWGEAGPGGQAASCMRPPAIIPELEELPASQVHPLPWYFRDLPYSHDYFLENVTDPAHVGVSHHKMAGNRYNPDQYFAVDELQPPTANGGFKYRVKSRAPTSPETSYSTTTFLPPSLIKIRTEFQDGGTLLLALYSCPTRPGHTRHIGRQILIRDPAGRLPRGLAFFAAPMPVWLSHTLASLFLHQDQVFLHHQEHNVAARSAASHTAKYFMPTPADNMTVALRTWLARFAGGRIPYATTAAAGAGGGSTAPSPSSSSPSELPLPPRDRSRDSLFDTFTTHTRQCSVCSTALRNLRLARTLVLATAGAAGAAALLVTAVAASAQAAAAAAAGASAGAATSGALLRWPPLGAVAAAVLAAVLGGVVVVIDRLVGLMHRYEFSHADNP
ncbi:hypothetical protein Agub_g13305 [Astrephomene gubernaculifera]|uniref:Rieske domain-containing protein n=1 Tax=Astrephomene gubernaculifera TaxID=47775 RepID=A0AAD3DZK5_9CHLO|nr:hypothetical protein Agub_g13305 [Astrephomene gubernaculifera]